MHRQLAALFVVTLLLGSDILACELEQAHHGCKIYRNSCVCGFGCKSEYRYSSNKECKNAREGENNICARLPCLNRGTCIQISQDPGFKCRCDGTGFYGNKCERACPPGAPGRIIPYECVVI